MSAATLLRINRLTLQTSRRWFASSSQLLTARSNGNGPDSPTPPATDDGATEQDTSIAASTSQESAIEYTEMSMGDGSPEKSSTDSTSVAPTNVTKGRKVIRKARRSLPSVSKSFLSNHYFRCNDIKTNDFPTTYTTSIPDYVWDELLYNVQSGLAPKSAMFHSDHILVNVAGRGATYMQDSIARRLATECEADLIQLDPQDLALLSQECSGQGITLIPPMSIMDKQRIFISQEPSASADDDGTYEPAAEERATFVAEIVPRGQMDDVGMEVGEEGSQPNASNLGRIFAELAALKFMPEFDNRVQRISTKEVAQRYAIIFNQLLNNTTSSSSKEKLTAAADQQNDSAKIVYLRDFGSMNGTEATAMLKLLTSVVDQMKQKGHRMLILAGYSPSLYGTDSNYKLALRDRDIPLLKGMRSITIPPPLHDALLLQEWEAQLKIDKDKRIAEVNAKEVLARLQQKNITGLKLSLGNDAVAALSKLEGIQETIWSIRDVERYIASAVGNAFRLKNDKIGLDDFKAANAVIRKSILMKQETDRLLEEYEPAVSVGGNLDMDVIKKRCDEYELRLLSRVVDPAKVQCSFKDVRAPRATIETLQTLITLPLVRPELFQHGILKSNFIPGVLLFGPPGTGKTMLAKAVAKESGSRMLEIQASDIYDMYVGESEKNIKAMFTLARKLSPCVIFIDEVDSLLSRRRSDVNNNAHREMINQLMAEWDGLTSNNQGVMVMAATNRPFDLDDAALRRMPRRILVDLPKEEDRAEIIKLLLREDEHRVSVAELARLTEHYSGSDLKNLCVTAALRAVQQEAGQSKEGKWVLTQEHFDEALKQVLPSSSEDMESVVEIRKWAEKYGDGGSKRKKQTIGFS